MSAIELKSCKPPNKVESRGDRSELSSDRWLVAGFQKLFSTHAPPPEPCAPNSPQNGAPPPPAYGNGGGGGRDVSVRLKPCQVYTPVPRRYY